MGTLKRGFFIADSREKFLEFNSYANKEDWGDALDKLGIPRQIALLDPDEVAATRPDRELRPGAYTEMKGLWGLSDGSWSTVVFVAGALLALLVGVLFSGAFWYWMIGIPLGLVSNVLCNVIIAGDQGGPAFVGMIASPLLHVGISYCGRSIRKSIKGRSNKQQEP